MPEIEIVPLPKPVLVSDIQVIGVAPNVTFRVTTASAHGLSDGDKIYICNVTPGAFNTLLKYAKTVSDTVFDTYDEKTLTTTYPSGSFGSTYVSGGVTHTAEEITEATIQGHSNFIFPDETDGLYVLIVHEWSTDAGDADNFFFELAKYNGTDAFDVLDRVNSPAFGARSTPIVGATSVSYVALVGGGSTADDIHTVLLSSVSGLPTPAQGSYRTVSYRAFDKGTVTWGSDTQDAGQPVFNFIQGDHPDIAWLHISQSNKAILSEDGLKMYALLVDDPEVLYSSVHYPTELTWPDPPNVWPATPSDVIYPVSASPIDVLGQRAALWEYVISTNTWTKLHTFESGVENHYGPIAVGVNAGIIYAFVGTYTNSPHTGALSQGPTEQLTLQLRTYNTNTSTLGSLITIVDDGISGAILSSSGEVVFYNDGTDKISLLWQRGENWTTGGVTGDFNALVELVADLSDLTTWTEYEVVNKNEIAKLGPAGGTEHTFATSAYFNGRMHTSWQSGFDAITGGNPYLIYKATRAPGSNYSSPAAQKSGEGSNLWDDRTSGGFEDSGIVHYGNPWLFEWNSQLNMVFAKFDQNQVINCAGDINTNIRAIEFPHYEVVPLEDNRAYITYEN